MKRFIPLFAVLALLLILGLLFGPQAYRSYQFRRSMAELLEAIRGGDLNAVVALVEPAQQQQFAELLGRYVPDGYQEEIQSLRMARYDMQEGATIWALVNCRVVSSAALLHYQGKLHWEYQGGAWRFDPAGSYAAPLSPSGEPEWRKLAEIIQLATAAP